MPPQPDDDATIAAGSGTTRSVTPFSPRTPGDTATPPGRFAPGVIIAGRYRLVALLGRGGMGEVYRADDLTLDQPVALKFLPEGVADDAARLTQFHNELRIARQVSHKNVCRLYDLGEAEGRRFLTMEYVDGEDLGSLLRRIGRFPEDRAVAIARQMCAGVAAAHDRGVIHRDLKPANVMIDGEGHVRITDFGIATAAADTGTALIGTPQYMAPEQLVGRAASIKSDIYALGLILFEVFTGKRAHDAKTIQELKSIHETATITTPSSIVRDLDPAVERVILRCLERDPTKRPASALAVAAALPGGDPLAAALAAGETPSPDVLAAAAETDAIPVLQGLALVVVLIAAIGVYAVFSPRATMAGMVPLEKPPAVLEDRAQQILREFGYDDKPEDTAHNFVLSGDFPRWLVQHDETTNRWNPARVAIGQSLLFWYRTSPRDMEPDGPVAEITPTDPTIRFSDQSLVILDTRGRLVEFRRVPLQRDSPETTVSPPVWDVVFREAGLDRGSFTTVAPEWAPKDFADVRAAWEGPSPDDRSITVRVEAAAYRGRIVSFYLVGPWARPRAQQPIVRSARDRALQIEAMLVLLVLLVSAALLARRNLQSNRADRRGAARLALLVLLTQATAWAFGGHHTSTVTEEVNSFFRVFGNILFQAGLLWVLYLAVEAYGRRFWPDGLLGWTRLFSGRVRDPRFGRELLVGCALGGVLIVNDLLRAVAPYAIGRPPGIPSLGEAVRALSGPGTLALIWSNQLFSSLESSLIVAMLFVGLRLAVRKTWIAIAVGMIVLTIILSRNVPPGDVIWLFTLFQLIAVGIITFALVRFGLLVTAVMLFVDNIPTSGPFLVQGPSWAALPGYLAAAVVVAIAAFGFYAARAGQPLFGSFDGAGQD